jgi:DNA-directed RNA polymerase specialized sigma24 family protein
MDIGPLEYVVIGVPGQQLTSALISELNAIQESGQICVVDLVFVTTAADGAVVMQEVSELPEIYRAAVTLRYTEEMSYEEIAGVLKLPINTVRTHLFRAKALLKKSLAVWERADRMIVYQEQ